MITSAFTHSAREWIPTKEETLEAMLATKAPNEKYSALIHPSTQEFIDFDVMGRSGESANIGAKKEQEKVTAIEREEEKNKSEQTRDGITASIADMQEYREQQMQKVYDIDGYQFTQKDMKKALEDNMDKYLQEVEEDNLPEFLMLTEKLKSGEALTDAEVKRLNEITPSLKEDSENNYSNTELKASSPEDNNISSDELSDGYDSLADLLDDPSDLVAKAQDSELVQTATAEVQESVNNSDIAKPSQGSQDMAIDNDAIAPVTPKGFDLG